MGDRCNVAFKVREGDRERIFLYSHWGGSDMPEQVRNALIAAKGRWNDPSYCCRIMVSRIVLIHDGETGWGLSLGVCDNDGYPILEVDIPEMKVRLAHPHNWNPKGPEYHTPKFDEPSAEWSFEEFIAMSRAEWSGEYPYRSISEPVGVSSVTEND